MSARAALVSFTARYARTEENRQVALLLNGRPVGLGLTNINQKWMNMLVHIATTKREEIDYIQNLIEASSDAELIRKMALCKNDEVVYMVELEVNPKL